MQLAPNQPVVLDGILQGEIVSAGSCGQHLVRVTSSALIEGFEPYTCVAVWDGDTRSAEGNRPLLVSLEQGE